MTVIQSYHTLKKQVSQMVPTGHSYRERNLSWLLVGIKESQSVHTSKIAAEIPGQAKRPSQTRRIERFLDNEKVRVREWYRPTAEQLLKEASRGKWVRLIIDSTKVSASHQLLMVAVAYRRRALPLVWTWQRGARGHSSGIKQKALLSYAHQLMPDEATVVVTGDSEFTPLQEQLEEWGWFYALRQKGSHLFQEADQSTWERVDSLVNAAGQQRWLPEIRLTKAYEHPCCFLAYWAKGEDQPWLIATNLPSPLLTKQHYNKRMWIEGMFGDFKTNGADLEKSRLQHFLRLSRLTLAVSLLYIWLVAFGSAVIKRGDRHLVDRKDRRDLSIYRIGYDMFKRCLLNQLPISLRGVPYFHKFVSGN